VLVPVSFSKNVNNEGDFLTAFPPTAPPPTTSRTSSAIGGRLHAEALTFIHQRLRAPDGAARALRATRDVMPRLTGWAALINAQ
jgi:hypothetical protein